jgi:hypothetical protein
MAREGCTTSAAHCRDAFHHRPHSNVIRHYGHHHLFHFEVSDKCIYVSTMSPLISQSFGTRHISAWYTTEQNKKMLTSFNASTGSLGATLCDASRDAVKEEFTQVLKEQSILQVPLGRA